MPDNGQKPEKLVIMVTHGPDEPERAVLPFSLAGAAVAFDMDVVVGFQGDGVRLAQKGVAETVSSPGFAPLGEILATVQELGGKLLVCRPGAESRGLTQNDLVDGAELCLAVRFLEEIADATHCLVY